MEGTQSHTDKGDIAADHHLGLSHDIIGKVAQPNFCSRFVARFIVSDCLPEVAENRRFLSAPISVSRIVYHAVIPPSGASENLGKNGSGFRSAFQRSGSEGSRTNARKHRQYQPHHLPQRPRLARVLKPPVSIRGLVVTAPARFATRGSRVRVPFGRRRDFAPRK